MGLIDDLRQAAPAVDPQFQPSTNELPGMVGALVAYVEHGDKFLKAAQDEENASGKVTDMLSNGTEPAPKAPAAAAEGKK
jgi:hypothetical protein